MRICEVGIRPMGTEVPNGGVLSNFLISSAVYIYRDDLVYEVQIKIFTIEMTA